MQLFVGLGNPGDKYRNTRHNIGFMAVDRIWNKTDGAPWKAKFQAVISEVRLGGEKVLLIKPETFMNLSGQSVGEAMRFYKLAPEEVTVFHDELDLPPGKCRSKTGGGHAGHNGLRSIHQHIGAEYHRIRLGIGHPGDKKLVSHYVLHDFAKQDQDWLDPLLDAIADASGQLAQGDRSGFMTKVALLSGNGDKNAQTPAPKTPSRKPSPLSEISDTKTTDERSSLQKLIDKFK
ncbi:MAG: aminoacyl-tRNA hydrolase [Paracoccaceae bacterium]|jgi:PTH1 family peptidyl-tRNA hydrolase